MLKIGDFSRVTQVSIKTLRYYDELGLFKPAHVDPFTGYRYFSMEQVPRLHQILALKELGFALEEMKDVLDAGLSPAQVLERLKAKRAALAAEVQAGQQRLEHVDALLDALAGEAAEPGYEVLLKHVEALRIMSARLVVPHEDEMSAYGSWMWRTVSELMVRNGAQAAGPWFFITHNPEYAETDVDAELAVTVAGGEGAIEHELARQYTLPAVECMASLTYHGHYAGLRAAYIALGRWLEVNACEIVGPGREIYWKGPGDLDSVIEIQFPVAQQ